MIADRELCFHTPTELVFGRGVSGRIGERLAGLGIERVLLVTDAGIEKAGIANKIRKLIEGSGAEVVTYAGVVENPTDDNVHEGAALIRESGRWAVVNVGGGSPIDAGKAMSMLSAQGGDIADYETGKQPITLAGPPVFSIPTTAGTGSEATYWSVITDTKTRRKFDVGSPLMAAALSLVDPELTISMPPAITAATGMDAMCHAVEAYVTMNAGPVTDALALRAMELIARNLPKAYADGSDLEARAGTMLGAMTAGMSFSNAGLGAVHGLTAPLGGRFGVPHGVANAIMLPEVMRFNLDARRDRYARVAQALGADGPDADEAVRIIRQMNSDMAIPALSSFGITDGDVEGLAADSIGPNSNCNANPRPITGEDAAALFRAALGG